MPAEFRRSNPTTVLYRKTPEPGRRPPEPPPDRPTPAAGGAVPWPLTVSGCALVLALLTLARLIAASTAGLAEDEAYYRLWALAPSLGYYDHPPMIGWLIAAGTTVFGDTTLGIRAAPIAATLLASLAVWRIAWLMTRSEREAGRATIWFNATLTVGIGGLFATPDAPSLLFWALALWALAELRRSDDGRWWLAVGTLAGLGLLSKYSGLFLGAGVVLWLVLVPSMRRWFRSPWFYAGGGLALLLFLPVVRWNAAHDWVSFVKQFGRAGADGFRPLHLVEFVFAEVGLIGPLMVPFLIVGAARIGRLQPSRASLAWMLIATSAPFLVYLVLHGLHDPVQGNWPAPLFAAVAIVAALAAGDLAAGQHRRMWLRAAVAPVGVGIALLVFAHLATDRGFFSGRDPSRQLRGWPAFAATLDLRRRAADAGWIGTVQYGTTGELAFSLGGAAPVVPLFAQERYTNLPIIAAATLQQPGLVVVLERRRRWIDLGAQFEHVEALDPVVRSANGVAIQRYLVFRVDAPRLPLALHGVPARGASDTAVDRAGAS